MIVLCDYIWIHNLITFHDDVFPEDHVSASDAQHDKLRNTHTAIRKLGKGWG